MPPRISAVVPIYNVAAYLDPCLESLAQQRMGDIEVVMVDDGSTDESAEIAEGFASRDPRFRLIRQKNAGLGAARNTGIDHAVGEFIHFVDSDDAVPLQAYEVLLSTLDRTGSDFASGSVRRLTSFGTRPVSFLAEACSETRLKTHITEFPALVYDRTIWNKLFRRSFWDEHELRFPEGVLYEDIPVTLPAHFLAKSVDVVNQTVYLWRLREGDDLSITQRRTDVGAMGDRVDAVMSVDRFLARQGLRDARAHYQRTAVANDLRYFLNVLNVVDDEYRRVFLDRVNEFLDGADESVFSELPAIERLKWHLLRQRAVSELLEVLRFQEEDFRDTRPVRVGDAWFGDYPFRADEELAIPSSVYRLGEELRPVARVRRVAWEGSMLVVEGHAYIDPIGAPTAGSQKVELRVAREGRWRKHTKMRVRAVHRPDLTANVADRATNLDWAGFEARIDASRFRRRGGLPGGTWGITLEVCAGGVTRSTQRFEAAAMTPVPSAVLRAGPRTLVRAGVSQGGGLAVNVEQERPTLLRSSFDGGAIQLEGDIGSLAGQELSLQVARPHGDAPLEYPVFVDRSGERPRFLARIPAEDLLGAVESNDESTTAEEADGVVWAVYLSGDRRRRIAVDPDAPEPTWSFRGRELAVHRTRFGNLSVIERSFRPVIDTAQWSPGGVLSLGGTFHGPPGDYEFLLAAQQRPEAYAAPLAHDAAEGRFTVELEPGSLPAWQGTRPLPEGSWELLVRRTGARRDQAASAVLGHGLLDALPLFAQIGHKRFRFGALGYEKPLLRADRDLEESERGRFRQLALRSGFYEAERRKPLREAVLYDSFGGGSAWDSPRAIHDELVRRGTPVEHLWVVRDGAFAVPETATPVREQSREYYEAYARARFAVANDYWPRWARRRPDQTWIQTWHGGPLKQHGEQLAGLPAAAREHRRFLCEKADNWDVVLSPAPYATPIIERSFPVGGRIVETGLPRRDALVRGGEGEEVRSRLGLSADDRVLLYAPTYRDDLSYRSGYRLSQLPDFATLVGDLGEGLVVLVRRHPLVVDALPPSLEELVRDVSGYPDTNDLLLASDVLVTDYSSIAQDFAVTGKPIVFFAPDLEKYLTTVRGFSVDFERDAPGPIARTTAELTDALRDPEALAGEYRDRYEAYRRRYCPLDDGEAAARVVDEVFALVPVG